MTASWNGLWVSALVLTGWSIRPCSAENVAALENVVTAPGSSVTVQLFLTHQNFLQGFQVVLLYDRKILTFESATVGGLDLVRMGMPPEFFEVFNEPEFLPVLDRVSAGVLFDAPDEYLRLPPGDRQTILAFHFQTRKDSTLVATCCNHPPASCI